MNRKGGKEQSEVMGSKERKVKVLYGRSGA